MDNLPEFIGRAIAGLIFALPAVYFLDRALRAGPRSRRLGNLALFCGLAAFILPETVLRLSASEHAALYCLSGGVRILVGMAGIGLAIAAFVNRGDGKTGATRPILGVGLSLWHIAIGIAFFHFVSITQPSRPWVYHSPAGDYSLTLPSPLWKPAKNDGGPAFGCLFPRMQARVAAVHSQQSEADFARAVEKFRMNPKTSNGREGASTAGNSYYYCTTTDSAKDGKTVFVAYSATWCREKQIVVEVIFEGLLRKYSDFGKKAEMDAFAISAETICLSVE